MLKVLREMAEFDHPAKHPQVCALTGDLKDYFRLRISSCRIIFSVLDDKKIIAVVNRVPRGDAY